MAKKKQKEEVLETPSTAEVTISQEKHEHCEWCFQFDDGEPQVFAWTDDEINSDEDPKVTFTISNTKDAYISFTHFENGKTFKLFSRELSEKGRELRDKSKLKIQ